MKNLGIAICVLGSIFAIIYPPVSFFGFHLGWEWIWVGESGIYVYNFINWGYLILELFVINLVGLGLYLYGRSKKI